MLHHLGGARQVGISAAHWVPLLQRESSAFSTELRLRNVVMEINKSQRYVRRKSMFAICSFHEALNVEVVVE